MPGSEQGAGEQDCIFQPLEVSRVDREDMEGAGAGGDGEMLRVSIHCFYSTQCSHLLKYA